MTHILKWQRLTKTFIVGTGSSRRILSGRQRISLLPPSVFFLLHQQYHTAYILLHRSFVDYGYARPADNVEFLQGDINHASLFSRNICLHHAIRVTRIFSEHGRRFDTKRIFVTGMQHAGTAATALIAEIATSQNPEDRREYFRCLKCLADALEAMAETYQPAERMSAIVQNFIRGCDLDLQDPPVSQHMLGATSCLRPEPTSRKCTYDAMARQYGTTLPANIFSHVESSSTLIQQIGYGPRSRSHSPFDIHSGIWTGLNPDSAPREDHRDFMPSLDSVEYGAVDFDFRNAFDLDFGKEDEI